MSVAALDGTTSRHFWTRRAILLSWFTVAYNILEGIVAIGFGITDDSVALAGFGVDSFIEVASALLVLWRFRKGDGETVASGRERATTRGIGILFLLLAVATFVGAGLQLISHRHPETTFPGTVIALISLSFMFYLWKAKLRAAHELQSASVKKDADCSMACIKLSGVLLLGSLLFLLAPALWWTDGVAAIVLAYLIGREGWETVQATSKADFSGGCGCHSKENV